MAMRPFPLPLGLGTDVCRVSRIARLVAAPRRAYRLVRRLLAPEEAARHAARLAAVAAAPAGPDAGELEPRVREELAVFLAGRFAAKEAAMKAFAPRRRLTWHDIIIELDRHGGDGGSSSGSRPPVVRIRAADGDDEDTSALVSISHDGNYATAVCIAHLG